MSTSSSSEPEITFDHGEAYQRCMHELGQPDPDYQAAQVYATLSLEEALRDVITQLDHSTKRLIVASRRL